MHSCREHAIRESCNVIFVNSFSLFISILLKVFRNTLDEWEVMIYIHFILAIIQQKIDHLSLNIRQNNRYYRFGSYILNTSSTFFEFFRTNTFCNINTRNIRENGRQATYY